MMLVGGNYKFKIAETNKEISPNTEFKALCWNEKITLQLFRNDTIVKGTWKLGTISISDTTKFILDKTKPISDTLKVVDKDSHLLASIAINIYHKPFTFRIVELNKSIQAKTEFPVLRRKGKYSIQLFRGDSLVKCNWIYGTTRANDTATFVIDLMNVRKDSIKVYDKSSKQLAAFMVNIYNKPDIKLENKASYDGSFGFDNFYNNHATLATDANYRSHHLLGNKKWIPWLSVYKAQPNVQLQLKINNDAEFLRDSMAYIKINASHAKIKANITTIPGNTIKFSDITSTTNTLDFEITVEDHLDDNQYLYFTDNANDTLAMVSVLCKEPSSSGFKLNIVYLSDSTTVNAFSVDTSKFDKKSYNQAFVDWSFSETRLLLPFKDTISKFNTMPSNVNALNTFLLTQLRKAAPQGIGKNILTNSDGYFLIIIPLNSITTPTDIMYGAAFKSASTNRFLPFSILSIPGNKNTIAIHEVAHTLQLDHIFIQGGLDVYNLGIGQGTTKNYLDYSDPNMFYFWKWQWKLLNNTKIP